MLRIPASSASLERLFVQGGADFGEEADGARVYPWKVAQVVTVRGAAASGLLDN